MYSKLLLQEIEKHSLNNETLKKYAGFFEAISGILNKYESRNQELEMAIGHNAEELVALCNVCQSESALLKKAQEEIKTMFENVESVFFSVDLQNFKINQMSAACEKVYGYTPEEFMNNLDLWFNVIHPEDKVLFASHNENLEKGMKLSYQCRIIHKDGSIRWLESKVIPTLDAEGKLVRIDGVANDITEKKEAEKKIKKTERLLIEAQNLAKMGNWEANIARKEVYWSKGWRNLFGVDDDHPASFEGFIELIHPDDKEWAVAEFMKPKKEDSPNEMTYRIIRHKDGAVRTIHSITELIRDEENKIARIYGVTQDITEKKAAEEKMHHVEHLLTEAQQLANMGNWNVDMLTGEVYISNMLREILGIDKDHTFDTKTFISLIHAMDKERVANEIQRILEHGGSINLRHRITSMNKGEEKTLHTIVHAIKDRKGKLARVYGISKDITERSINERKIEQFNVLLYQISHDLRGPINSAKNYIYLAQKRVEDETARNYLNKIQDAYGKMEHRVLSLLDMQRLNRAEVNFEPIDMEELIKNIVSSIDGLKGFSEVNITTDINVKNGFQSDKQFLHSILHNLISNAITHRRAIPDANIHIQAREKAGRMIITVSDNGKGIPEKMRGKMFQKFVKGDTSANGTGLGLYIVKKLTTKLKGEVAFESEPMQGTTFTVTLPLVTVPPEQKEHVNQLN